MSRCNNCGFQNPENLKNCQKCNAELAEVAEPTSAPTPPVKEESNKSFAQKTVKGGAQDIDSWDDKSEQDVAKTVISRPGNSEQDGAKTVVSRPDNSGEGDGCTNCGYPLIEGTAVCPECNTPVSGAAQESPAASSKSDFAKTVNPWSKTSEDSGFSLSAYERDSKPLSFADEKDGNILNRATLNESDNNTISGENHASIVQKNGKWIIANNSSQKTTFVMVQNEQELKDGDVVLIGDSMFVFNSNS